MSAGGEDTNEDSALGRVGDGLESLLFGERSRAYTWFVRSVVAAFLLLGLLGLLTATPPAIDALTGVVFALFVLTALLQVIALARRLQRGQETIAHSADALEASAEEVTEAAEEVATLSEEAMECRGDDEAVKRTAGDVKAQGRTREGYRRRSQRTGGWYP
jgi:hypothetical protein